MTSDPIPETAPPEPKRGCRKRGWLLGCPAVILLVFLIGAGAPPLLGMIARSDYQGPAATAIDWLPSFGAAAVPELLSVIQRDTPAGQSPEPGQALHGLIRLCGADDLAREVLIKSLKSGQAPPATAATVLFAATGCGWNATNDGARAQRSRAANALAETSQDSSDARRACATIRTLFAEETGVTALGPIDAGQRKLDRSKLSAAATPLDLAKALSETLGKPVRLSEAGRARLKPQVPMLLPSTPRISLAALLRMIEGSFDATPAVAMIPGGGASIRVRAEDHDGLGVALVDGGDHLELITTEERLEGIMAVIATNDSEE